MFKSTSYNVQHNKKPQYNNDGLRPKRLKEENRWRFDPNKQLDEMEEYEDEDSERDSDERL